MKAVISAVILAVAILLGFYLVSQSMRYELGMPTAGWPFKIDRQTGVVWFVTVSAAGDRNFTEIPTLDARRTTPDEPDNN